MSGSEELIAIAPNVCNGKPAVRCKRITVQTILDFLSGGDSIEEILENYPTLTEEDVYACLKFATCLIERNYTVEPVSV